MSNEASQPSAAGKQDRDQTSSDGLASLAILALTIAFIVAIVVFQIL